METIRQVLGRCMGTVWVTGDRDHCGFAGGNGYMVWGRCSRADPGAGEIKGDSAHRGPRCLKQAQHVERQDARALFAVVSVASVAGDALFQILAHRQRDAATMRAGGSCDLHIFTSILCVLNAFATVA